MAKLTFAKHETFYIRDGWLYKGIKAVEHNPTIFAQDDAPQLLGLGKNMVRSLRYWMLATQLSYETLTRKGKEQYLTPFGLLVNQYDPYQELDGTLWLIHYHLVINRSLASAWYWFFNHYVPSNFTRQEFVDHLIQWVNTQSEVIKSEQSLAKDFDCLVRTYISGSRDRSPEDSLVSPLVSLGLLSEIDQVDEANKRIRHVRLNAIRANSIPPLVFLFVLIHRQEEERQGANQISLMDALREPKNVGRVFNIGLQTLEELLVRIEQLNPAWTVRLTRTGGLDQLSLPTVSSNEILEAFYQQSSLIEDAKQWSFQIN